MTLAAVFLSKKICKAIVPLSRQNMMYVGILKNIPKVIFYLLKGDYTYNPETLKPKHCRARALAAADQRLDLIDKQLGCTYRNKCV